MVRHEIAVNMPATQKSAYRQCLVRVALYRRAAFGGRQQQNRLRGNIRLASYNQRGNIVVNDMRRPPTDCDDNQRP